MRRLALLAFLLAALGAAVTIEGVPFGDTVSLAGKTLRLNGAGVRVYSALVVKVNVYAAGLYLETPSRDAAAILASPEVKLGHVAYLYDVSRNDVVRAWRDSFEKSCTAPCRPPAAAIEKFLALAPGAETGHSIGYVIAPGFVELIREGTPAGRVEDADFPRLLLATFIGQHPPTEELKRALLGG